MKRVVIVSGKRTPFGKFLWALAEQSPVELALAAGNAALAGIDRSKIDQVILGNVLSAGHGMNIARQVAVKLGLPQSVPGMTLNTMCGSGLHTAMLAVHAIRAGESRAVLVGGTESMSQSALLVKRPGKNQSPDLDQMTDSLQRDGLLDSFSDQHMGQQAEELAVACQISRLQQDAFAYRSQQLYATSQSCGRFENEVISVGDVVVDQHPRSGVTLEQLSELPTAFQSDGSVTVGNASGINDGAAMLLIADYEFAREQNWPILAEWVDGVIIGCDPQRMGLGPVPAITQLLERTHKSWEEIDTLEINEAFAAQTLACLQGLKLSLDLDSVSSQVETVSGHQLDFNADGGAIAIGHPLAVSGARLLCHLALKIAEARSSTAIGSLCIGGGMGIAAMLKAAD